MNQVRDKAKSKEIFDLSSFFMVTLNASLVFSSTSLSNMPPSPNTWSGVTNFPLGANTLAYFRLNSVGGYLEASEGAEPVLGDISNTCKEEPRQKIFLIFELFLHLNVSTESSQPVTAAR